MCFDVKWQQEIWDGMGFSAAARCRWSAEILAASGKRGTALPARVSRFVEGLGGDGGGQASLWAMESCGAGIDQCGWFRSSRPGRLLLVVGIHKCCLARPGETWTIARNLERVDDGLWTAHGLPRDSSNPRDDEISPIQLRKGRGCTGSRLIRKLGGRRQVPLAFHAFWREAWVRGDRRGATRPGVATTRTSRADSQILKGETQKGKREKRRRPACPAKSALTCTHSSGDQEQSALRINKETDPPRACSPLPRPIRGIANSGSACKSKATLGANWRVRVWCGGPVGPPAGPGQLPAQTLQTPIHSPVGCRSEQGAFASSGTCHKPTRRAVRSDQTGQTTRQPIPGRSQSPRLLLPVAVQLHQSCRLSPTTQAQAPSRIESNLGPFFFVVHPSTNQDCNTTQYTTHATLH